MTKPTYIVATIKPWNLDVYQRTIQHFPGEWHLVSSANALSADAVRQLAPRYIFFPHWSHVVPASILSLTECVCFHETDVPYGRGGSPIQNLIARGHSDTVMTALKMTDELDAGPVYLKRPLSLDGTAHEIFNRAANLCAEMIRMIIDREPKPTPQSGKPVIFTRRTPKQSRITPALDSPKKLYDHIRMLDAPSYPHAFYETEQHRYEFFAPSLENERLTAQVNICPIKERNDD